MPETPVRFLGWEVPWRRDRLSTPVFLGFSAGSESPPAMRETWGPSVGWENPLDGVWQSIPAFSPGESPWTEDTPQATVRAVTKESD